MKRWTRREILAVLAAGVPSALALAALLAMAYSSQEKSPSTPASSQTLSPSAQSTETVPRGTSKGRADLDAIIDAALDGDAAGLQTYFLLQPIPCSNALGLGGPPPCRLAPSGSAPDGTLVNVFPLGACDLGWLTDVSDLVQRKLTPPPQLYAVVELTARPYAEPFLPMASHGIIFETDASDGSRHGWMLLVQNGDVVFLTNVCQGPPEEFFQFPPYQDKMKLILEGPAFP